MPRPRDFRFRLHPGAIVETPEIFREIPAPLRDYVRPGRPFDVLFWPPPAVGAALLDLEAKRATLYGHGLGLVHGVIVTTPAGERAVEVGQSDGRPPIVLTAPAPTYDLGYVS